MSPSTLGEFNCEMHIEVACTHSYHHFLRSEQNCFCACLLFCSVNDEFRCRSEELLSPRNVDRWCDVFHAAFDSCLTDFYSMLSPEALIVNIFNIKQLQLLMKIHLHDSGGKTKFNSRSIQFLPRSLTLSEVTVTGDKMKHTVTRNEIKKRSGFEQCWKHWG